MAAVAAIPVDLRGTRIIHRTIDAKWRSFFRPPEGNTGEILASLPLQGVAAGAAHRANDRAAIRSADPRDVVGMVESLSAVRPKPARSRGADEGIAGRSEKSVPLLAMCLLGCSSQWPTLA